MNSHNAKMFIYLLLDEDGTPRYVGKTLRLQERTNAHRRGRPWMASLMVLEATTQNFGSAREKDWISTFRAWGFPLENKNNGGSGALAFTAEQKQRVRERRPAGWKHSPEVIARIKETKRNWSESRKREYREAIRARTKGIPKSDEHKAAMSRSRKGVPASPRRLAVLKRIADQNRGKKRPPEVIAKYAASLKGHAVSAEARAKIGAAQRGKTISEEQRRAHSAKMKGRKCTPEHVANMRRARWGRTDDNHDEAVDLGLLNTQSRELARKEAKAA